MIESMSELEQEVKEQMYLSPSLTTIEQATGIAWITLDRYRSKTDVKIDKYNLLKLANFFGIEYSIKGE